VTTGAGGGRGAEDEDVEAVRAFLARRDEERFVALYRRHTPYLYRLALRLLGGRRAEAEDAVQETWLRSAARLAEFRGESSLRTWLAGFAINCCRETRRRSEGAARDEAIPEGSGPPAGHRLDLDRAIAALPHGYREVLVLHDLEGYTHEEIALRLAIAPGTSKSQLSRARRWLRERIT
jgi:RNA polymerase sigma-70 factor (ECF subfamily)